MPKPNVPPMVGLTEMTIMFGVARITVDQWRLRDLLPAPDQVVSNTPLWQEARIAAWAEKTGRRIDPGWRAKLPPRVSRRKPEPSSNH